MKIVISQDKDLELTEIKCTEIETSNDIIDLCGISKLLGEGISSFTAVDGGTGFRIYSPVYDDTEITKLLKNELRIFDFEFTDDFYEQVYILPHNYGKVIFDETNSVVTIILNEQCNFLQSKKVSDFLEENYYDEVEIKCEQGLVNFHTCYYDFENKRDFVEEILDCLQGA